MINEAVWANRMSGAGPYAASGLWGRQLHPERSVMTDKNVNMAEVLQLTRSGRVMEATGLLQRGLSGAGAAAPPRGLGGYPPLW